MTVVEDHYVSTSGRNELGDAHRRFRAGEPRAYILVDLIKSTLKEFAERDSHQSINVLDIGCGKGIDDCGGSLQQELRTHFSGKYIGVEPDTAVTPNACFDEIHATFLEDAKIPSGSIQIAYSNFVLEHIPNPKPFWDKLYDVLDDGGVFWGLTIDGRHPFSIVSNTMDRLHIKDIYLNTIRGKRGTERYNNYPAYYRANTPSQVIKHIPQFKSAKFISLNKVGMLGPYFPKFLRPLVGLSEQLTMACRLPGIQFLMRIEK